MQRAGRIFLYPAFWVNIIQGEKKGHPRLFSVGKGKGNSSEPPEKE
jgi:hypothetical protein